MEQKKTAIILGATGLTGNILLKKLLTDNRYKKVKLFSRNSVNLQHEKIEEHLIDLFELENYQDLFNGDEVFCCVGSTQKKTPDNEVYKKVDYGIPLTAAKLAKKNNIQKFVVISALGANAESKFFYNKTKGEMENAVLQQKIEETYILRPSLISGKRKEKRPFEFLWKQVMKLANFLMCGPLKKFRSIHPNYIADAMIFLANNSYSKTIIESEEIKKIASKN
ncbi:NAD(P)H-binding protein [Mesonia aquimarina]|uniref:NAD(P)H-binding protein n=1 Tax=Mesonia aquimarina TaxID=1504967 RepID=UPI000EF5A9AB|nr:NAD(P)H-binding protein [Mesonia aquimarina]